ncbi:CDGSH iron-sulfur domain-containing protein [Cryobacterium sp. PH31-L1]|uniref:CDGSH iron-sulfur domain-containing protein n=1 Tax=Cryobacterium sp. PH31-L1 TaxID=3046199 RepID=UPI0024BA2346|nr:CDGSH iron-sulfur domain-containing protein [Cryobacterium sp. PH31-L1]MDJ0379049.1 CDGSH iron-sulfur domain-containing protein [Cryobacterium sp. PH31-L1]
MSKAAEPGSASGSADWPIPGASVGHSLDPIIIACQNGPLLVRGSVELRTAEGEVIPQLRATIALCRCGVSSIKPFCDGTHKLINFQT